MLPARFVTMPAVISDCGTYRYWLRRTISPLFGKPVCFIMHNPSTADHTLDDPTIRRCIGYTKAWGGSDLIVVNRFAYRSPKPADLWLPETRDPVGPDNDDAIMAAVDYCHAHGGVAVAAWGCRGANKQQQRWISDRTKTILGQCERRSLPLHTLKLSGDGVPWHPLYLPADLKPARWAA